MKNIIILLICLGFVVNITAQTQNDTLFNYKSSEAVVIDGKATEACWELAEWNAIDQIWIPFGADVPAEDFSGKFKVSWDEEYLYLLVEVVDDSLSDDYEDPLSNWWDDDCLEIFIDENRSQGNHECNNNAFAYHLSLFYDAIDLSPSCDGINYKEHVKVVMDTIGENTYLWEMAIEIYDDSYKKGSVEEESRVSLIHNKEMGLAVAYCDSDEDENRENFIGSMEMTSATHNDMYKNADHFGLMILIDENGPGVGINPREEIQISLYPNPVADQLNIQVEESNELKVVQIYNVAGVMIFDNSYQNNQIDISVQDFNQGIYYGNILIKGQSKAFSFVKE